MNQHEEKHGEAGKGNTGDVLLLATIASLVSSKKKQGSDDQDMNDTEKLLLAAARARVRSIQRKSISASEDELLHRLDCYFAENENVATKTTNNEVPTHNKRTPVREQSPLIPACMSESLQDLERTLFFTDVTDANTPRAVTSSQSNNSSGSNEAQSLVVPTVSFQPFKDFFAEAYAASAQVLKQMEKTLLFTDMDDASNQKKAESEGNYPKRMSHQESMNYVLEQERQLIASLQEPRDNAYQLRKQYLGSNEV